MFHFPKILIEIFNVFAGIEFSWSRFEKRFVGIKSMWMKTATKISFLVALIAVLGFLYTLIFQPSFSAWFVLVVGLTFAGYCYAVSRLAIWIGDTLLSLKNSNDFFRFWFLLYFSLLDYYSQRF